MLGVPELVHLHVTRRQFGLVLHELGDGIANSAGVGAVQALDDLLHPGPRDAEGHLVVLRLAEDAVARAREDHLGLAGLHGRDDDVRAHGPALEGGGEAPAALPERSLRQAHHLGRSGVDADDVRLEGGAVERGDEEAGILAGDELVDGRFRPAPRLLGLGVHALAERADIVDGQGLVEADRGDAEGAHVILARERDGPAVPAGHVDDLAAHAELLPVAPGPPRPLRNRLVGLEHANRHGEGLRPEIRRQLPVRGLDVEHEGPRSFRVFADCVAWSRGYGACRPLSRQRAGCASAGCA